MVKMPPVSVMVKPVSIFFRRSARWAGRVVAVCGLIALPGVPPAFADDVAGTSDRRISLDEAVVLLRARSRDLTLARRAVEAADADIVAARARPNPVLSLSAASIRPFSPGGGAVWNKPVDAIAQLSQLIERGNKRELRGEVSRFVADAARADVADVERQQVFAVRTAYFDLLQSQERVAAADETLTALSRTVAAAELRLKAGDISPADLARIQVDALRAQNERRIAVAERDRTRGALAYLTGLEAEQGSLVAADVWPAVPPLPELNAGEAVVDRRADIRAARLRSDAAEKARGLAQALRTRDVTVAAQVERFPGQDQNNSVGFGVSVPLFLNYTYDGEIRRAEANALASRDLLDRSRAVAVNEARRAWSDLAAARDRVLRFDGSLLREATRAADAAEFAYRNGALGVIDLLDARRVLYATRVESVAAHADLARAIAAWNAVTQPLESTK